MDELTQKEQEIYNSIVTLGLTNIELAKQFSVTLRTIESHISNILNKNGVGSQKELIIKHYKKTGNF